MAFPHRTGNLFRNGRFLRLMDAALVALMTRSTGCPFSIALGTDKPLRPVGRKATSLSRFFIAYRPVEKRSSRRRGEKGETSALFRDCNYIQNRDDSAGIFAEGNRLTDASDHLPLGGIRWITSPA